MKNNLDVRILEKKMLNLSEDGNNAAAIQLEISGTRIAFWNVHMAHPMDKQISNLEQFNRIENYLTQFRDMNPNGPTVLAGDFNATPSEDLYGVVARNYEDASRSSSERPAVEPTCTSTTEGLSTGRLDYIFTQRMEVVSYREPVQLGELVRVNGFNADAVKKALNACGSDHLPVYAELRFK